MAEEEKINDASSVSSMDEDGVTPSEREYLSSDWEEEITSDDLYWAKPRGKSQEELNAKLARFISRSNDSKITLELKKVERRKIMDEHQRKLREKRARQEVDRLRKMMRGNFPDAKSKVDFLIEQEFKDKKLHRGFYYAQDELETYKELLGKRRKAIYRKYENFLESPKQMTKKLLEKSGKIIKGEDLGDSEGRSASLRSRSSTPKGKGSVAHQMNDFKGAQEMKENPILSGKFEGISPLQLFNRKLIREGDLLRKKLPEISQKLPEDLEKANYLLRIIEINGNSRTSSSPQDFKYFMAFDCLKRAEIHSGIDILSSNTQGNLGNPQKLQILSCLGKTFSRQ